MAVIMRSERGDISIVLTFIVLTVLTLSGMVLAVLAIRNIRGSQDIQASSDALYAADTALEAGLTHYHWSVPYDAGEVPPNICTVASNVVIPGQPGVTYDIVVTGDPAPVVTEPNGSEDDGTDGAGRERCPTQDEVRNRTRALCITAIGEARGGSVRRRIQYDTDASSCRPPP